MDDNLSEEPVSVQTNVAEQEAAEDQADSFNEDDDNVLSGNRKSTESKSLDDQQGVSDQLEVFRQQWHNELQQQLNPRSRGQSPRENQNETAHAKSNQNSNLENEASAYFMQGMQAEDDGLLTEAIYYYRKALQLVPDIESRIGLMFTKVPRERARQDSESSVELKESEDLLTQFEKLRVKEKVLCVPEYEQRMVHIASLPVELIIYILQWVVSNDLDLKSLEMFSLVCRGFYTCARDERIWKKACEKVWGVNLGNCKKFGSWRRMMIERPHLLFDGCYISKVTYIRQGEQSMDSFYRPFHLVEYFRYVRFFPDGHVLMLVSPEDPLQSLPKLKLRNSKAQGMLKGVYKLTDHKVACVLKRVKTETMAHRYKRHRQAVNQNELEMTYTVDFDLMPSGRRPNAQLVWCSYAVSSVQKSTGEEIISNFELNKRTFPPLIFSRVKSYSALSNEPLL
ncbi:F-box only protein 9 [Biomphalaria pfeifferi]|uniref:F-box only protein 9 n=1 Tax=Biomphalaria pfeifferi TaxID=112525 RepID=A0AAD8BG23_BIOPF|nr:F-box only protein 9 [Biomphalaria pfeifferi]